MDQVTARRLSGGTHSARGGRLSPALRHGAQHRDADAVAADVGQWGGPRFSMDFGKKMGTFTGFYSGLMGFIMISWDFMVIQWDFMVIQWDINGFWQEKRGLLHNVGPLRCDVNVG